LALLGDGVENPEPLAGTHIKTANVSFIVAHALWRETFAKCGADYHGVLGHNRRRLKADLTGGDVGHEGLVVILLEIDGAVVAKGGDQRAGLCVKANQPVAGRYIKDALFFSCRVRPISQAGSGELAWRRGATCAFALAMHPEQLARSWVQGNHRPPRAGRSVELVVDHERGAFQLVLRAIAQVVGL